MQGARDQLLAGAAFPLDQDRGLRAGDLADQLAQAFDGRTAAQQLGPVIATFLAQELVDAQDVREVLRLLEDDVDLILGERLD